MRTRVPSTRKVEKPAYSGPSMAEISAVPWNGFNVVSTFSGCGGSCLGYRMAGFKVLWASEFVEAARDTYKLNHPDSILDGRDIRTVAPEDILSAAGMEQGEIDILDGSPPCASFSLSGKREDGWGKVKMYSDTRQRTDDLFFEYARILRGIKPKVFIAENVAGLLRGTAKGYFKLILAELKSCGYRVEARLLDAQFLGVPQMRQRVIFMGVRDDLKLAPAFPKPLPYVYTVTDACPWIAKAIHDTSGFVRNKEFTDSPCPTITVGTNGRNACHYKVEDREAKETDISGYSIGPLWDTLRPGETHVKRFNLAKASPDRPCPTITATGGNVGSAAVVHPFEKRKFTVLELKRLSGFPDDFILTGTYQKQWERIGRAVPPVMMAHVAMTVRDEILCRL